MLNRCCSILLPYPIEDSDVEGEQRFVSIGRNAFNVVLVIVYTYREDHIRLISARRAIRKEVRVYEKGI